MMTQQQSEILEKIESLLSSPDIEMVKLGAQILSVSFHHDMWPDILNKHCKEEERTKVMSGGYTFVLPIYYKWHWNIKTINRRKKTAELEIKGPQEYFSSTLSTTVNTTNVIIHTGSRGMNLFNQALKQKLKTNKYEHSKINKVNKSRTRTTFK